MALVKDLVLVITPILGLLTLFMMYRQIQADHERRRKQATLEYLQKIQPLLSNLRYEIDRFAKDTLTFEQAINHYDSATECETIRNFLIHLEHMAVGLNNGVFDKAIMYEIAGSSLVSYFNRFANFTEIYRQKRNNPKAFKDFEQLKVDYANWKKAGHPNAPIRYSKHS